MKRFFVFCTLVCFLAGAHLLAAAKMSLVIMADVDSLGESGQQRVIWDDTVVYAREWAIVLKHAAKLAGLDFERKMLRQEDYTLAKLQETLANWQLGADDAAIFVHLGAGHRDSATKSRWPNLDFPDGSVPLSAVVSRIQQRKPRMVWVVADTPNTAASRMLMPNNPNLPTGEEYLNEDFVAAQNTGQGSELFRALFRDYRGTMISAAALPEQTAYVAAYSKGMTLLFIDLMKNSNQTIGMSATAAWERILRQSSGPFCVNSDYQHAQYEIHTAGEKNRISFPAAVKSVDRYESVRFPSATAMARKNFGAAVCPYVQPEMSRYLTTLKKVQYGSIQIADYLSFHKGTVMLSGLMRDSQFSAAYRELEEADLNADMPGVQHAAENIQSALELWLNNHCGK